MKVKGKVNADLVFDLFTEGKIKLPINTCEVLENNQTRVKVKFYSGEVLDIDSNMCTLEVLPKYSLN